MTETTKQPPSPSLDDLHEILQMYNEVTQRLQVSHERLEQEVVRLREQLEQKNRELELKKRLAALGEMAAGIAHEIRNPLGGIQLYASTLAAEVADRPLATDLVKKISTGVKGLNSLVSDMLTFTANLHLARQNESLSEIIEAAIELARPTLMQHAIAVEMGPSLADIRINADGKLLQRVLLNLILNAADAIGETGVHASACPPSPHNGQITITAEQTSTQTSITVEDNGPGIPHETLERIFNPFFTTKHSGTGLGLAIVHRIIEAHGGSITAENRHVPEHGARFKIVLFAESKKNDE
ncbi:MAG: ATP-binding protein [Phycisphaerales bacterium]|nr:ATP-binding protein [Phycisphaerales bacterium]